jgi:hypothetical protein
MLRLPAPPESDLPDDAWARRILQAAAANPTTWTGPGRVLRVKLGYNPNSSSVGSVVTILMWSTTFGAMAFNIFAALVARQLHARDRPALPPSQPDAP